MDDVKAVIEQATDAALSTPTEAPVEVLTLSVHADLQYARREVP